MEKTDKNLGTRSGSNVGVRLSLDYYNLSKERLSTSLDEFFKSIGCFYFHER